MTETTEAARGGARALVGAPPLPSFGAAFAAHARLAVVRTRRGAKLKLALAAIIPITALVIAAANYVDDPQGAFRGGVLGGLFTVLAYLLPFLFGAGAIGEEVTGRTVGYLLARPSSRLSLVLARWSVATAFSAGALALTVLVMHLGVYATSPAGLVDHPGEAARAAGSLTLLAAAYSALTLFFGAAFPRTAGLAGGLYLACVEFVVAHMPFSFPLLALNHHARNLSGIDPGLDPTVPTSVSLAVLLACVALWLGLAVVAVVPREFEH